jgi:hypothetical protein
MAPVTQFQFYSSQGVVFLLLTLEANRLPRSDVIYHVLLVLVPLAISLAYFFKAFRMRIRPGS